MTDDPIPDLPPNAPPETFAELRERLANGDIRLPKRLKQVAAFALAQPDEIALGTVAKIAEDAGVQPSTLVRFGQALGFAGFTDLQAVFRERLRNHVSNYDERMLSLRARGHDAAKTAGFLDGLCEAASRSISAVHERTDLSVLDRAATILAGAETIYLLGQRRSFPVSSYLSYAFGTLGIRNTLIGSPLGTDTETMSFATTEDAVLAVSFTPYAASTIAHAQTAGEAGIPLVAFTDSPFSPLCAHASAWFEIVEADFQGFRSLSASLALAMTLVVAVADRRQNGPS
ncbi:MurR/RpiR family transcriptional regulator [Aureimonas sp. ME7]|uniref:MurR/RpiR family transcriptional regulator n=1 Tax=Aureimonas sp. ME7 TaxID=2744252 RepID=UPI0015F3D05A|nr:MurR/RpiR family transcriptional regulator [Aureimonas sp. ME7]